LRTGGWRRARRAAAAAVLLALPFLTGCIYLRLLELKRQLGEFDRYVAVETTAGLKLTFREPVLLDRDMAFLGLATTDRARSGVAERWHVSWAKVPVAAEAGGPRVVQSLDFVFVDRRLTTVIVPERFFVFFPKDVLLAGLRAMGRAKVDREKRTVTTEVGGGEIAGPAPVLPRAALERTLGAPTAAGGAAAAPEWHYVFAPEPASRGSGGIGLTFTIDAATGQVRRIRGRLISGTFDFTYPIVSDARAAPPPGP